MSKESSTAARAKAAQAVSTDPATNADESTDATAVAEPGSASERAQAMRANLGARRDAEALLAEASQLRRTAAADADTMVAEAESIAEQLVTESRQAATQTTVEAQERADAILARARAEAAEVTLRARTAAEDLERNAEQERDRMREEIAAESRVAMEALRAESDQLLRRVEFGVHGLAPALEGAMSVVTEVIGSLEKLRAITPGEAPDFSEEGPEDPAGSSAVALPGTARDVAPDSAPEPEPATVTAPLATVESSQPGTTAPAPGDDEGARPLGWLFRASQQ